MDKKLLSLKEVEVTSSDVVLAYVLLFDNFSAKGTSEAAFKNKSSQNLFKILQENYSVMIVYP